MSKWRVSIDLLDEDGFTMPERFEASDAALNVASEIVGSAHGFRRTKPDGVTIFYPASQVQKIVVRPEEERERRAAEKPAKKR